MPICAGSDGSRACMVRDARRCRAPHHEGLAAVYDDLVLNSHVAASRRTGGTGKTAHAFVLAALGVRVLQSAHPRISKRAQGRPGARYTHGPRATRKHAAEPQVQPRQPGLPCAMVLRLIRALPGDRAVLPPSPCRCPRIVARSGSARIMQGLTPASGRQDHTISPSARATFVSRAVTSIASPPHVLRRSAETSLFIEAGCAEGSF